MKRLKWLAPLLAFAASGCSQSPPGEAPEIPSRPSKVLVIGIPGVEWADIGRTNLPVIEKLISSGASGNMALRVSNLAGEGYATIGAGRRSDTGPSAALAFDRDEVVEHGVASDLFERRGGTSEAGNVVVAAVRSITRANEGRGFDSTPGLLAQRLALDRRRAAVVGNADLTMRPLPSVLPSFRRLSGNDLESGIHREAALLAMSPDGTVSIGTVARDLLEADPQAPYGIRSSSTRIADEVRRAAEEADLIVVEAGDTSRADSYSAGLSRTEAADVRSLGLKLADELAGELLETVDPGATLVIVVAPSTPGGPRARGELRPVIAAGPGIGHGLLTSTSTRRDGFVTASDVSALIASYLGLSKDSFESGRRPTVKSAGTDVVAQLEEQNTRAVVHDQLRTPILWIVIGGFLAVNVAAVGMVRSGGLPGWMRVVLLGSLAFPIASYVSRLGPYRAGALGAWAAILAVTVGLVAITALATRSLSDDRRHAAAWIVLVTLLLLLVDAGLGGVVQLDSILGYTSVAGGRFFGLGNLGFAVLASSAFLVAGSMVDTRIGRWPSILLLGVVLIAIGHPSFGADFGGTIAMVPAVLLFGFEVFGKRLRAKSLPLIALASVAIVLLFGFLDLARGPQERSHLGNFIADVLRDPVSVWLIARRKIGLSVSLSPSARWGLATASAALVLFYLRGLRGGRWRLMAQKASLGQSAGLRALIVAAIVGSLVNDSGVAVAGMMLSIAAPWALIYASETRPVKAAVGKLLPT